MLSFRMIILIAVALTGLAIGALFAFSMDEKEKDFATVEINGAILMAEVVSHRTSRARGLSGREMLGEREAMLFIFDEPDYYGIWMKDMKFPIDIIWLDDELKIIGLEKNINPNTFPEKFSPPSPAKFVLEVNGGWSDENKIKEGMTARILNK